MCNFQWESKLQQNPSWISSFRGWGYSQTIPIKLIILKNNKNYLPAINKLQTIFLFQVTTLALCPIWQMLRTTN